MCYFCFPEHVPEGFRLAAHGIEQSHDFVMGMDCFHIDSKQVFLLLTGWSIPGNFPVEDRTSRG